VVEFTEHVTIEVKQTQQQLRGSPARIAAIQSQMKKRRKERALASGTTFITAAPTTTAATIRGRGLAS
jgi:hypothetical protein